MDQLINIELFGQAYTFKANRQVAHAQEVANYVATQVEKARSAAQAASKLDTLILAVLNIANDYFEMRSSHRDLVKDIDERCRVLIDYLEDSVLN